MDILYITKAPAFACEENELRYSLRSIAQYGRGVGRVFVCGYCPDWLSEKVVRVPFRTHANPEDVRAKNWDIAHKILYAVAQTDISEEFLVSMDDHFYCHDTDFSNYPAYVKAINNGQLPASRGADNYNNFLYDCRQYLLEKGLPTLYFTLHRNMPLTRTALRECSGLIEEAERRGCAVELFTLVNNYRYAKGEIAPVYTADCKIRGEKDFDARIKAEMGVFSTFDFWPFSGLAKRLAALFPNPCVYEREIARKRAKRGKGVRVACVCMCKREENYIDEWLEHHFALGFDDIYILDNNDWGDEAMREKVDAWNNPHLHYIDIRGKRHCQREVYNRFYADYREQYEWVAYLDADEFLTFEDSTRNLKDMLTAKPFRDADEVRFCWKLYGDSDLLDVVDGDYSVKRFTRPIEHPETNPRGCICKSIINTRFVGTIWIHGLYGEDIIALNSAGEPCNNRNNTIGDTPFYGPAWINHYRCKTIGEFVRQKVRRGDASEAQFEEQYDDLSQFFLDNPYNKEKANYAVALYAQLYPKKKK